MTNAAPWGGDRGGVDAHHPATPSPLPLSRAVSSLAVSWWSVVEYVEPMLAAAGSWPMLGTPEWVGLPDDHPAKLAALLDAARHWALRVETAQEAQAEASKSVAASADWPDVARQIIRRTAVYIPREQAS